MEDNDILAKCFELRNLMAEKSSTSIFPITIKLGNLVFLMNSNEKQTKKNNEEKVYEFIHWEEKTEKIGGIV